MSASPLVSIITPSLNQGRFLDATLRSVASQDYPFIEHIVLDGGSTDESLAILETWALSHSVRWHSGPDEGQADAIQRGIEMSNGDIVAWLNSDDVYLSPGIISSVVSEFLRGATVVTGGGWYISEDGHRLKRIPVRPSRLSNAKLRCVDWVLQPATFIDRELILSFPLDASLLYAFDWDLFVRLSAATAFTPIDAEWAGYRVHGAGKTVTGGGTRRRELLKVIRRHHGESHRLRVLSVLDIVCGRIEALPRFPRSVLTRLMRFGAYMSNVLTDGQGSPFAPDKG